MATWSSRRKLAYGGSILIVFLAIAVSAVFSFLYKSPTCFDSIKNGNELGVDCGGSCVKLCQSAFLPPVVKWGGGKYEKIADGIYNIASYIVNPNTDGAAVNVPYKFTLFDSEGILITERKGFVTLPAHRNALAFESAVDVGRRNLAKVTFEFTSPPEWFKSYDSLNGLVILDKKYNEEENRSSLQAVLENRNLTPYGNIAVSVILYDRRDNAIGFSRTKIDAISSQGKEIAPFTWPTSRGGRVTSIEVLLSGSPSQDR
ncbi:MAG: hypothetical protein Q8Q03_02190 [bacterium]|nr:hypothetical protein [bacterium]